MCDVKIYSNPKIGTIRAVELDGQIWMFLKDILNFVGGETTAAKKYMDDENYMHIRALRNHYIVVNHIGVAQLLERRKENRCKNRDVFEEWVYGGMKLIDTNKKAFSKTSDTTSVAVLSSAPHPVQKPGDIYSPEFWQDLFAKVDTLRKENEQLRSELEKYKEKAALADTIMTSVSKCMRQYS